MFTFALLEPDHKLATAYFTEHQLNGWAYFANRIGRSDLLQEGKFYVIGNTDADPEKVDNLKSGWQIFPPNWRDSRYVNGVGVHRAINYAHEIVMSFCEHYVILPNRVILFEDFMAAPTDGWLLKEPEREYYTIGNILLYPAGATASKETIRYHVCSVYKYSSIGLFVRNADIQSLKFRQQLSESTIECIWQNIEAIVWEVYDGDSYAFWIRNGHDGLLHLLQEQIHLANGHLNK